MDDEHRRPIFPPTRCDVAEDVFSPADIRAFRAALNAEARKRGMKENSVVISSECSGMMVRFFPEDKSEKTALASWADDIDEQLFNEERLESHIAFHGTRRMTSVANVTADYRYNLENMQITFQGTPAGVRLALNHLLSVPNRVSAKSGQNLG